MTVECINMVKKSDKSKWQCTFSTFVSGFNITLLKYMYIMVWQPHFLMTKTEQREPTTRLQRKHSSLILDLPLKLSSDKGQSANEQGKQPQENHWHGHCEENNDNDHLWPCGLLIDRLYKIYQLQEVNQYRGGYISVSPKIYWPLVYINNAMASSIK